MGGKKQRLPGKGAAGMPPPALHGDAAADLVVDDDDVAFVQSHRRQLQHLANAQLEEAHASKRRQKRTDYEDIEQPYERAPRLVAEREAKPAASVAGDTLPTKAADGSWVYKSAEAPHSQPGVAPEALTKGKRAREVPEGAEPGGAASTAKRSQQAAGGSAEQPTASNAALAFDQLQEQELSLSQKKERIAAACAALLEAPERNVSELKILHRLASDSNNVVARLACLSAMLVYKDLAPGYRIRPPTDKELDMAVSKEVRATRDYETAFLKAYQSFLQLLLSAAGSTDGAAGASAKSSAGALDKRTSLRCMCGLLQALPQFNYRSDLLRALIPRIASSEPAEAEMVNEALSAVLKDDKSGEATLETVQLIADLVKRCECDAPAGTLNALKSVRFDDSFGARLRSEREKGKPVSQKQRNRKWIEERRRLRDEAKAAARKPDAKAPAAAPADNDFDERTLRDFDALPDTDTRLELQTSTLEAVCEIYFRILKDAAAPEHSSGRLLLGETFAGLARVAHLIDYEVVADILEVLRKLLAKGGLTAELRARCLLAACDVLGGQGAALTVDTRDFHRHLYCLAEVPPTVAQSVRWGYSRSQVAAGESGLQASVLWARSLSTMLLARSHRQVDTERVAAFAKRLSAVAFHAETGEAMGALAVVNELLNRHQKLRRLLENEAGAAHSYMPDTVEPESACALSSCLWEVSLLQRHVHPSVAALATHVACLPVEDAAPPAPYGSSTVEEVTAAFSTACGGFKPAVPAPKPATARRASKEARQAAFERTLKQAAAGESELSDDGLRTLFREARAFLQNAKLRAQVGRMRAIQSRRRQKPAGVTKLGGGVAKAGKSRQKK